MYSEIVKYRHLWENSSFSSEFPAQTITVDTSNYRFIVIRCISGDTSDMTGHIDVIVRATVSTTHTDVGHTLNVLNNKACVFALRTFKSTGSEIHISDCSYKSASSTSPQTDNNYIVPRHIYGVIWNYSDIAGIKISCVWSNASWSSGFSAQSVSLSYTKKADMYLVSFCVNNQYGYQISAVLSCCGPYNSMMGKCQIPGGTIDGQSWPNSYRYFSLSTDHKSMHFFDAVVEEGQHASFNCIPYAVYGVYLWYSDKAKVYWKTLWGNSSLTSTFAGEQYLDLGETGDLDYFDAIIVICTYSTVLHHRVASPLIVGVFSGNVVFQKGYVENVSNRWFRRDGGHNGRYVYCSSGYKDGNVDDSYCIPTHIMGVKWNA